LGRRRGGELQVRDRPGRKVPEPDPVRRARDACVDPPEERLEFLSPSLRLHGRLGDGLEKDRSVSGRAQLRGTCDEGRNLPGLRLSVGRRQDRNPLLQNGRDRLRHRWTPRERTDRRLCGAQLRNARSR